MEQTIEAPVSAVSPVIEVEESVKSSIRSVVVSKEALKKKTQEIKDRLLANSNYSDADEKLKIAQKNRAEAKKNAVKQDETLAHLIFEKKQLQADVKNYQLTLSDYLNEYVEKTGSKTIANDQGDLVDIETFHKVKTTHDNI